jgi:MazG family protein
MRAEKVQKKAAKVGFDWSEIAPVIAKVREELAEIEAAGDDAEKLEEEVGDLLFATVNLARKLKIDGEVALHRATEKFAYRFRAVESLASERGLQLSRMSLSELDLLWDEVKARAAK